MSNDTVVVPTPPPKPMLSIPVIPHEQICHAQHVLALLDSQELTMRLTSALTSPIGGLRAEKLLECVAKAEMLASRIQQLIAGNKENDRMRQLEAIAEAQEKKS